MSMYSTKIENLLCLPLIFDPTPYLIYFAYILPPRPSIFASEPPLPQFSKFAETSSKACRWQEMLFWILVYFNFLYWQQFYWFKAIQILISSYIYSYQNAQFGKNVSLYAHKARIMLWTMSAKYGRNISILSRLIPKYFKISFSPNRQVQILVE